MMSSLVIQPQKTPLKGTVRVPGDKSISHRAVMLAAIAQGNSVIRNWLPAGDTIATLGAMRALGTPIRIEQVSDQAWHLQIEGRGFHGLQQPAQPLDCRNAGTCMRLLAGILAGQRFPSVLDGSEQLRRRPMGRIVSPLQQMGADIEAQEERAPLHIRPANLKSIDYALPVASAQVKSAVLLAGLYARGETRVYQPGPARDHTERLLQAMGATVQTDGRRIALQSPFGMGSSSDESLSEYEASPEAELRPLDLAVPGDQ
jgi:3-phosphoshikimate 1-carboxyvinyltransferase